MLAIDDRVGGPHRPRACIQRAVFGGRVVVMARSDESDRERFPSIQVEPVSLRSGS
ncbi:hypothetical protein [Pseudonocardia adelaidensis]|uniref:hypothetical protein n=1 Tax=Pseudonocardia adelaidensis TaxID=648754 RepID=UPI0031EDC2E1